MESVVGGSLVFEKLLKKETVVESATFTLIFLIIERVIQTIRGIVFARMLGPSELGVYTLSFFLFSIMVTFARLGIPSCYGRYIPQYEKKGLVKGFFRKSYLLAVGSGVFFTVLLLFFSTPISELLYSKTQYSHLIILCTLSILPFVLYENFLASFNGLRVFKVGVLMRFSQFLIFTATAVGLIIFYPKAEVVVATNLLSYILVSFVFGFIIWKYILHSTVQKIEIHEENFYGKILKYSIWFMAVPIFDNLFNYTDRFILNKFLGLEEVGIYSTGINVSNLILMFGLVVGSIITPSLSHLWENGEKHKVVKLLNLCVKVNIVFLLFISVIISLFKEKIVFILYGQPYMESVSVINILLIYSLLSSTYWTIWGYTSMIEKTYIPLISNSIGFVCNVVLNYILIPIFHMKGAAIATTISFIICFVIINIWMFREGFKISSTTIFLYLIPGSLIMGNIIMSIILITLVAMIIKTNLIISEDEKNIILEQVRKSVSKYRTA